MLKPAAALLAALVLAPALTTADAPPADPVEAFARALAHANGGVLPDAIHRTTWTTDALGNAARVETLVDTNEALSELRALPMPAPSPVAGGAERGYALGVLTSDGAPTCYGIQVVALATAEPWVAGGLAQTPDTCGGGVAQAAPLVVTQGAIAFGAAYADRTATRGDFASWSNFTTATVTAASGAVVVLDFFGVYLTSTLADVGTVETI